VPFGSKPRSRALGSARPAGHDGAPRLTSGVTDARKAVVHTALLATMAALVCGEAAFGRGSHAARGSADKAQTEPQGAATAGSIDCIWFW